MTLLADLPQRDYPADYLLARLKGRKSMLVTDWSVYLTKQLPATITEQEAWKRLLLEFRWVYLQMNKRLRKTLTPMFFFFELRTLVLCLRYKSYREEEKINDLLAISLLPKSIQSIFKMDAEITQVVEELANYFAAFSTLFAGIANHFSKSGLRELEQMLSRCYLEYIVTTKLRPAVKSFLKQQIDCRNVMGLAKSFRWETAKPPSFINGGNVSLKQLIASFNSGSFRNIPFAKETYIAKPLSGEELALLEISLLKGISKHHQRKGRGADSVCQIIDYLWHQYIETRNAGLLVHGAAIHKNLLATELIQ